MKLTLLNVGTSALLLGGVLYIAANIACSSKQEQYLAELLASGKPVLLPAMQTYKN